MLKIGYKPSGSNTVRSPENKEMKKEPSGKHASSIGSNIGKTPTNNLGKTPVTTAPTFDNALDKS